MTHCCLVATSYPPPFLSRTKVNALEVSLYVFSFLSISSSTIATSATRVAHPAIGTINQNHNAVSKRSVPVGTPTQLPKRSSDVAMSWTQAVQGGETLLGQMTDGGPQSEFRSYADLADSGWSSFPTDGATGTDLEPALTALGAAQGTYGKLCLFSSHRIDV